MAISINKRRHIALILILFVLVIVLLPAWPYASGFGYYPSGGLVLTLMAIVALILLGKL
jgi:hypothetical protein